MAEIALLVGTLAAGAGQIYSGMSANQSGRAQASLQEEQSRIALSESERTAQQRVTERRRFLAEQRMAYLANGVSLAGTPGIVENETFKEFQMEIDAIRKSGVAQYGLGLKEAANTKATGRAQLTSGILSSVGTLGTGYSKYKELTS